MTSLVVAGATAKTALTTLALTAAYGTAAALLALAAIRIGKLRATAQAAVWLVVVAKFALPWGPAMPWSLADAIAWLRDRGGAHALAIPNPTADAVAHATQSPAAALGWLALATAWLVGATIVIARAIAGQRAARATARTAPLADARAHALLAELAQLAGVRAPRLAIGAAATGPHVVGWWRPIVVVPPAMAADHGLLRAALLHELAHVRRRDALARVLQLAVAAAYFWWPVVALVGRRLDAAREAACDAWALGAGELSRGGYARLLVQIAALHNDTHVHALGARTRGALDARVAAVLAGPPARARLIHKLALVVWGVIALGGARTAAARGHAPTCVFSTQLAESLLATHPEADLDGDGVLSPDEACLLEAELARKAQDAGITAESASDAELAVLLTEPLGCKLPSADGTSPADSTTSSVLGPRLPAATCQQAEGN